MDVIEAGFAASSPGDFEGVQRRRAGGEARHRCLALPRELHRHRRRAAALEGAPRSRIHIFLATSALHMEKKLRLTPAEVVAHATSSVAQACASVDEVEFSCEDATRSDPEFVATVCRAAVEAGATTINLPDTVGYMLPAEYASFIRYVRRLCPELEQRRALGPLPRRPRARGRELARGARRRRAAARVHGQRHRRARRERLARGDRDGDARSRRCAAGAHGHRPLADRPGLAARRAAHELPGAAEQGDRRRERVRPRGRHPSGRAAQGRRDLPDHRPGRARAWR